MIQLESRGIMVVPRPHDGEQGAVTLRFPDPESDSGETIDIDLTRAQASALRSLIIDAEAHIVRERIHAKTKQRS